MKYRILSDEELTHFSEELKQFLIVNGVHKEEWELMNNTHPEKARELVGLFSDTILQRVYENLKYLEFRSEDSCMVFYLGKDNIHLISLQKKGSTSITLSSPEGIHDALVNYPGEISFFKNSKTYNGDREAEVHRLVEQGCVPSSQEFWDALQQTLRD